MSKYSSVEKKEKEREEEKKEREREKEKIDTHWNSFLDPDITSLIHINVLWGEKRMRERERE